jgi:hypothetical protein
MNSTSLAVKFTPGGEKQHIAGGEMHTGAGLMQPGIAQPPGHQDTQKTFVLLVSSCLCGYESATGAE